MANSHKNIVITPNIGSASAYPAISFTGADAVSSGTITLSVYNTGTTATISFSGQSGQLFSISDTMLGTVFSANDVSGIPSIEVLDTGLVKLAQYNGQVTVSTATAISNAKLTVQGNAYINGIITATTYYGVFAGTISSGVSAGSVANALTIGTGLSGTASTYNGSAAVTVSLNTATYMTSAVSAGSVANSLTFNNGGSGAASGTTFNGSSAQTISYNTVGSPSTTGANASGQWGIYTNGIRQSDGASWLTAVSVIGTSGSRSTDLAPNTYSQGIFSEFKNSNLYGTSGNYAGLITYANWVGTTASTGDPSYQLLFSPSATNATSNPSLKFRAGIDTTWGAWNTLVHSGNIGSFSAGGSTQVNTQAQTANASYYPVFVSANNASATAMSEYTTSTFVINPASGAVSHNSLSVTGSVLSTTGIFNQAASGNMVIQNYTNGGSNGLGMWAGGNQVIYSTGQLLFAPGATLAAGSFPSAYTNSIAMGAGGYLVLNGTSQTSGAILTVNGGAYINGVVTATTFVGNITGTVTGAASQVNTQAQTANASYYPAFVSTNNASAGAMSVYTTSSFVINPATGYIGIGTISPTTVLHVNDLLANRFAVRIQSTASNTLNAYSGIGFSGESPNTKGGIFFQSVGTSYSRGNMVFALNNASDQSDATPSQAILTLTPTGGIGFGNTPSYGTSGQILQSNGNASPTWVSAGNITAGTATTATSAATAYSTIGVHSTGTGFFGGSFNGSAPVTWSLNTATLMASAVNLAGGATGQVAIQSNANATTFISTGSLYVGRAVVADSAAGGSAQVNTQAQTANASYYPAFVSANNATAGAMSVYTTSTFAINPATGNLGIGTASPNSRLQSSGAVATTAPTLGAATGGALYLTNTDTAYGLLAGVAGSGNVWLQAQRTDASAIAYNLNLQPSGGNVGVGTSTPGYKLEVNGSFSATTALIAGYNVRTSATLDLTALNTGTFYPVTIPVDVTRSSTRMRVQVGLNSGSVPGWSTHPSGFTVMCEWSVNGSGYGTAPISRAIHNYSESWTNQTIVGGITQMNQGSLEVIYLRGGGKYFFESDGSTTTVPTVQTTSYTYVGQTVTNTTTVVNNVWASASSQGGIGGGGTGGVGLGNVYVSGFLAVGTNSNYGTSGQILQSNGVSAPSWVNASSITAGGATLTNTYVGYGSASNTLTGGTNFTFDGTNLTLGASATAKLNWSNIGNYLNWIECGGTASSNYMRFATGNAEAMRIDSLGNLGLGVTPSAWSGIKAIEMGSGVYFGTNTGIGMYIGSNNYYNGTNYIYKTSVQASQYQQNIGQHIWSIAPSGTAGNAITFTQAMTLDASGNLMVGYTSAQSGAKFSVNGGTYVNGIVTATNMFIGPWAVSTGTSAVFNTSTLVTYAVTATNAGTAYATIGVHTAGAGLSGSTFNGSAPITWTLNTATLMATAVTALSMSGSAGSTVAAVTFNNGGAGDASGTTFNGSTARTISYNTVGAPSTAGTGASGTWGISISGNAATATSASKVTNAHSAGTGLTGTAFDGSSAQTWSLNTATLMTSSLSAVGLVFNDGPRDLSNRSPSWNTRSVYFDFVGAGTANGTGNYGGVMTFTPWIGTTASTGDSSYQLAFANNSGSNASGMPKLSIRNGIDTTWNSWYTLVHSGNIGSYAVTSGTGTFTGNVVINNTSPTIYMQDTDNRSCMIHCNSNYLYVLRGDGTNSLTYAAYNGIWPVVINLENNDFTSGGNVTAYSDIRIKENIVTIDNALDKTLKLRGIYYNRIGEADRHRVGVIAQEIKQVLPEVVISNIDPETKQDTLSVDYGNITALLIEAIKEQQGQIEELRAQIQELKANR